MLLTIDAGNTRTKWAIFNTHGEISQQNACLNEQLATVDLSPASLGYDRIVISNVAGDQHAALLTQKLAPYNLPMLWVTATSDACGVINRYTIPSTLGSDRWAALIAAWHLNKAPCIVVNAGTAVTIDALNEGDFMGGLIVPGLNLMRKSLGLAAAQLSKVDASSSHRTFETNQIFATSTADAIYNGTLQAITGAITQMSSALTQHCAQSPSILLSGGDAKMIKDYLKNTVTSPVTIIDHLVLQGLYLIHQSQFSNEK